MQQRHRTTFASPSLVPTTPNFLLFPHKRDMAFWVSGLFWISRPCRITLFENILPLRTSLNPAALSLCAELNNQPIYFYPFLSFPLVVTVTHQQQQQNVQPNKTNPQIWYSDRERKNYSCFQEWRQAPSRRSSYVPQ